jgi:hypothetical protein
MGWTVMAHTAADVAVVESRANSLCCLIGRVDDARDICHLNQTARTPILKGKVLYVYVTGTFRGHFFVDDVEDGLIIFMQDGWA